VKKIKEGDILARERVETNDKGMKEKEMKQRKNERNNIRKEGRTRDRKINKTVGTNCITLSVSCLEKKKLYSTIQIWISNI
jgi:hypothetical protein